MRLLWRFVSSGALLAAAVSACSSGDDDDTAGKPAGDTGGVGQVGGASGAGHGGSTASGGRGNASGGGTSGTDNLGGSDDEGGTSGGGTSGALPTPGTCSDYTDKLESCSIMNGSIDCSVPTAGDYLPCMYGCYAAASCGQIVDATCGEDTGNAFAECMLACDALEFECGTGEPIPASFRCDAVPDCDDGSDEAGCPPADTMFACGDGSMVPAGFRCDGFEDCDDDSDEADCPKVKCPPPPVPPAGEACGKAEEKLESCGVLPGGVMTSCLDRTAQAACEKTCLVDASCADVVAFLCDSAPADAIVSCLEACQSESDSFPCADGSLVPSFFLCDGADDCDDGADEKDCAFTCKNGGEVPYAATCDDVHDCKDGSDEDGCGPTCPAP